MLKPTVGIVIVAVIVILHFYGAGPGMQPCLRCARGTVRVRVSAGAGQRRIPRQLDKTTTARRVNTPVLHWVMMGMQGRRRLERGGRWLYPKLLTAPWKNSDRWRAACASAFRPWMEWMPWLCFAGRWRNAFVMAPMTFMRFR